VKIEQDRNIFMNKIEKHLIPKENKKKEKNKKSCIKIEKWRNERNIQ
jgi:hypothetical protein